MRVDLIRFLAYRFHRSVVAFSPSIVIVNTSLFLAVIKSPSILSNLLPVRFDSTREDGIRYLIYRLKDFVITA